MDLQKGEAISYESLKKFVYLQVTYKNDLWKELNALSSVAALLDILRLSMLQERTSLQSYMKEPSLVVS
jgi:hypothetical protein